MEFVVVKKLGNGAFGSVYEMKTPPNLPYYADHPVVAVKMVKNPDDNAEKEVETLKMLNHKGCIKFLDSFRDETTGDLCVVQEFCNLGDLSTGFDRKDEFAVWRFISHLAGALEHIHSLGHSDL